MSKSASADQKNSTSNGPASGETPAPRLATSNVTEVVASPSIPLGETEKAVATKSGPVPSSHQARNSSHCVSPAKSMIELLYSLLGP